ncbi:DeoR/GlpR family DNA-binding transcription regulator [Leisingera methylohalidivorans]|uniref:Alkaline phosphatase n=1 Tax=Leisingera methylohalidivorans DSM 14336 TaxID=999552 RepID=V9VWT4_9RHOB|nr:DeoR/GlpR family DNA-binding transcription regulator [Leisingera methylohalidivorans]AHD02189.1 alkaline phosphatase [Leisingera methylohalidivorans DSM 14336]
MWQEERHQKIRAQLAAFGRVSIDKIVEEFGVSRETIRRDLMEMETAGEVRRVRGGAVPAVREDTAFSTRVKQRLQEKRCIAATALQLLESGMTIFMDAGATSQAMADALAGPNGLTDMTVITNAVDVAQRLAERPGEPGRGFRVVMLAGDIKQDPMETHGEATINDIQRYHANAALLAPWGVSAKMGAMNHFLHGAEIARAMVRNSERRIILADHSKVGLPSRSVFCRTEDMDHLIVDAKAKLCPGFDELEDKVPGLIVAE